MTYNLNRGALFRNSEEKKENSPDYTGAINVSGIEYKLSGWIQVSKKGAKYLALAARPMTDAAKGPEVSNISPF